jgi:hypothetical protein
MLIIWTTNAYTPCSFFHLGTIHFSFKKDYGGEVYYFLILKATHHVYHSQCKVGWMLQIIESKHNTKFEPIIYSIYFLTVTTHYSTHYSSSYPFFTQHIHFSSSSFNNINIINSISSPNMKLLRRNNYKAQCKSCGKKQMSMELYA